MHLCLIYTKKTQKHKMSKMSIEFNLQKTSHFRTLRCSIKIQIKNVKIHKTSLNKKFLNAVCKFNNYKPSPQLARIVKEIPLKYIILCISSKI